MVGIRGIKNILFTVGSLKAFAEIGGNNENLWKHAYQTAFYSYNLAKNFCSDDKITVEDSYICGLLHDMGKIVYESAHPDFLENVKKACFAKGIDSELFEKILSGVNHGEIGARIAEKWNFSESIIAVIRFHHAPDNCPQKFRRLSSVVYIADLMTHFQQREIEFYQIDGNLLTSFGIKTEEQFQKISDKLEAAFKKQMEIV